MSDFRSPRVPLVAPMAMDLHERDMTATLAADVALGSVQENLAAIEQWLPIDGNAQAPVGELILHNSTGPLRLGYGAWRDLLLGVQFFNGRGELISAGGRTVKNVAGYDLTKFMVGSAGVFGKLATVTVRTYRRPAGAILVQHAPDVKILGRLIPTALRPQWAMLDAGALWCGYLGDARTIEYYRSALPQSEPKDIRERSVEEDIADRAGRWRAAGTLAFRAAVPPGRLGEVAAELDKTHWIADAAFGVVLGSDVAEEKTSAIRGAAERLGGSVRWIGRGTETESPMIDFSTNPVERQIIEQLKHAFDPDGALNPLPRQSR